MENRQYDIWNNLQGKRLLLVAMSIALLLHGVILYFTLPQTYDAFVHIFFADHYARFWFEPWEYRWYTGFLTISYPPLVHQMIALISKLFPLKVAFCLYVITIYEVLIVGVYRFSKLFFGKTTAGVAAILTVVLSSMVETLHGYGQAPTLTGMAFLLNSLPFLYQYFVKKKPIYLVMALVILAVVVSSHHVTAIFGMVFFIAPTILMALVVANPALAGLNPVCFVQQIVLAALRSYKQILLFGALMISLALGLIFPYWYWSKTDPITQVSIPHGSRDNFLEVTSSGLIFYVIPLALIIALLPAISYSITRQRRYLGWAVSFFLCLLFGSGGTTPIPKLMLGEKAFNILTLDRFGFWASIIAIPFMARFIHSFVAGSVKDFWVAKYDSATHFVLSGLSGLVYILFVVYIFHLASFRPLQPKEIEIEPMLNFLNRDEHMRWRFLTLGFGDQMAWLSTNTLAATVDGNYHSARRLPELTTRPVERLENAKYSGEQGLASLNDFLTYSEKYSLKYVFSNDRFYDPLLYFNGWNRTIRLENGIMVWEKGNISTIKPLRPTELSPLLKKVWGILPVSTLVVAILLTSLYLLRYKEEEYYTTRNRSADRYPKVILYSASLLPLLFFTAFIGRQVYELLLVKEQGTPEDTVLNYYNHLDFQRFEKAFGFFVPSPAYSLDRYLLEKSVTDGGLWPSYSKLDSIAVRLLEKADDAVRAQVFTRWRTSLGYLEKSDTLNLQKVVKKWYIVPAEFKPEIPEEQVISHTYTLFRKMGKRQISSFPTVKDDRIKKPFAAFKQVNFIRSGQENFLTGEILNADDIPVNIALKVSIYFHNQEVRNYFPGSAFQYNTSPKGSTFFQIALDNTRMMDSLRVDSMAVYAETDISERGYLHGGALNYTVRATSAEQLKLKAEYYNDLTTDLTIPGLLLAEKDSSGIIWQARLFTYPQAIRSGLHGSFDVEFEKISRKAQRITRCPVSIYINGQRRKVLPTIPDELANRNHGLQILPHCFMAQEIYLQ